MSEPEKNEDKTCYLVCGRVSDLHEASIARGSTQKLCCECKELIWTSPASEATVAKYEEHRYICIPCALAKMKPDDKVLISQAQRREMMDHFRRQANQNQSYGE